MKRYLLPLVFILLLTFTLIGDCAWLSGYDQRIKLTIDNTKIDAALSDFPVTIFFTSTQGEEIFTEFDADADYMKCAFTLSDGTTQLYAEKELFTYVSQYPPAQSDTYVKSTTKWSTDYWAYFATDPTRSLTGATLGSSWYSVADAATNQRFHIDLGSAKTIKKIYYENLHDSGGTTIRGVQNFIFQGSNTGAGTFDDLVYANDEGWTTLTVSQNTFDEHSGVDEADPKYITVTNTTAYRYYAFKFADNYGGSMMGVRRIELQAPEAIYHVKVASVASGADTDIYYYYDNDHADNTTYIGAINTTAGGHVWDSDFKAVYHMVDATTSTVVDSTSNNNDGTKKAANEPIEAIGKVGQGQQYDATNDYIDCGASDTLNITGNITIEAIGISPDLNTYRDIAKRHAGDPWPGWGFRVSGASGHQGKLQFYNGSTTIRSTFTVDDNVWHYMAIVNDNTNSTFYKDTTSSSVSQGNPNSASGATFYLGAWDTTGSTCWKDILDEVRISSTNRSAAWLKGTYNSLWDSLLTYGSEETSAEDNTIFFGTNF